MAKSIARTKNRVSRQRGFRLESLEPRNLLASATPDAYTINEDTVLSTGNTLVFGRGATGWLYNDDILDSAAAYPSNTTQPLVSWTAVEFDTTTSEQAFGEWTAASGPFENNVADGLDVFNTGNPPTLIDFPFATEKTAVARRNFTLTAAQAGATSGSIDWVCDDGCVVYLNGTEVYRTATMPAAPAAVTVTTQATGGAEAAYATQAITFAAGTLRTGDNVLAIENHHRDGGTDAGFDVALSVAGGDPPVGANDTVVGAGTYAVTTQPTNGTVTMQANGNFTYTPRAQFAGTDTFSYTLTDAGVPTTSTANVTITVNPVADAPVTLNDQYFANDGATISATVPVATPYINAGDSWSYLDNGSDQNTLNPSWKQGPTAGFNPTAAGWKAPAPADFGYGDGDETTVIDCDPDPATCQENPQLNDQFITSYFWRTFDIAGGIPTSLLLGTSIDDGAVVYINGVEVFRSANLPAAPAVIDYLTETTAGADDATPFIDTVVPAAALNLQATGNTISVEVHQDATTSSDVTFDLRLSSAGGGVLSNDFDPEGSAITATLVDQSNLTGQGTLTFNSNGTFTFVPTNPNIAGSFTFTYTASDGALTSAPATVTLTYTNSNAAPVATDDAYTLMEGTTLNVTVPISPQWVPLRATGWAINDELLIADNQYPTDAGSRVWNARDFDTATSTIGANASAWDLSLTAGFQSGPVTALVNPTTVNVPAATETTFLARRTFTLDSAQTAATTGSITYVCDSGCVFYINGVEVGSSTNMTAALAPRPLTPNSFAADAGNEDTFTTFTFDLSDLSVPLFVGNNIFAVEVHNDSVASSDIGFDASLQGFPPVPGVLNNDSDPEMQPLTATVADMTNVGGTLTLNPNGTFSYTPNAGVSGTRTFTYTASDGVRTSTPATVTFTITGSDSGPYTAVNDSYTTDEDVDLVVAGDSVVGAPGTSLIDNDTHPGDESDPVTITITQQPANGAVTLNGNTGGFTYNPDDEFSGADSFTYQVNDGFGSISSATVNVTVNILDDPPIGADDAYDVTGTFTVPATTTHLARRSNWEFLDSVLNGLQSNPASAADPYPTDALNNQWFEEDFDTTTGGGNGAWEFGPGVFSAPLLDVNPIGTTLLDGIDGSFDGSMNSVNTYLFRTTFNVPNGASLTALGMNILADDGAVVYINGTEVLRQNMPAAPAAITTTTDASANGSESEYVRHDSVNVTGLLHNGLNTIAVEVHQVNDTSSDVGFDMAITNAGPISVLSNDSDRENNPMTAVILPTDVQPQHGSVVMNTDGTFTFTPTAGYTGPDSFEYRANGATQSGAITVDLDITSTSTCTNDADLDNDNDVDRADLRLLVGNYGMTAATPAQGDINCDGRIGVRDVLVLRNALGSDPPGPSPAAPAAIVAGVSGNAVDRVLAGLDRAADAIADRAPRAAARLTEVRDRISQAADNASDSGSEVRDAARRVLRATRGRLAAHARAIGDLFDRNA